MYSHFKSNHAKIGRAISFMLRLLIIITGFIFTMNAVGQQEDVLITVVVQPPYPSRIDAYISQPNKIMATVINKTSKPMSIYLQGTFSGDNGISVYTDPAYIPPEPILIQPGTPFRLSQKNIEQAFSAEHLIYKGTTEQDIVRDGLPDGEYLICLRAFDFNSHKPLSPEEPQGCSKPFPILDIEPPVLIQPVDGDTLNAATPQNVIISFTRPPGAPAKAQFQLKIAEIMPPGRDKNDAINSAAYPVFFEKTLNTTSCILGPSDPQLEPGKDYAVQVTIVDPEKKVSFRNNGKSEVGGFTYGTRDILGACTVTAVNNQTDYFICAGDFISIPAPLITQSGCNGLNIYYRWYVSPHPPINADWIGPCSPYINIPAFTENTPTPGIPAFDNSTCGIYYIKFDIKFGWGCCFASITYKVTVYPSMANAQILATPCSPADACAGSCTPVTDICSGEDAVLYVPCLCPGSGFNDQVTWSYKDWPQNPTSMPNIIQYATGNAVNTLTISNNTLCATDNYFWRVYFAQPPAGFPSSCGNGWAKVKVWCHTQPGNIVGPLFLSSHSAAYNSLTHEYEICSAPGYNIDFDLVLQNQVGDILYWERTPAFTGSFPVCNSTLTVLYPPNQSNYAIYPTNGCDNIMDQITSDGLYVYRAYVQNGPCQPIRIAEIRLRVEDPFVPVLTCDKDTVCPNECAAVSLVTNPPGGCSIIEWQYQINCLPTNPWIPPPASVYTSTSCTQLTNPIGDQGQWYIPPTTLPDPGFSIPSNTNSLCWQATVQSTICPASTSVSLPIIIRQAPGTPVVTPAQSRECCGTLITLTSTTPVSPSTGPLTYQWYHNNIYSPIPGADQPTYSFTCSPATEGDYFIVVSNPCTSVQSNTVNVICCCIDISITGACCSDGVTPMTLVANATSSCGNIITGCTWTGPDIPPTNGCSITLNPPPAYLPSNTRCWEYTVTVNDNMGCSNSKTICILACP
jgi:TANFOR domain-containing protein